jgi:hypothetical protein
VAEERYSPAAPDASVERSQVKGMMAAVHHHSGQIDLEQRTLQTLDNPFGARLSTMS